MIVTFTLVASLPLTLIPVYPIPAPASEVVTTEGKKFNKMGKSCPKFLFDKSFFETFENVIGISSDALEPVTLTSSKLINESRTLS